MCFTTSSLSSPWGTSYYDFFFWRWCNLYISTNDNGAVARSLFNVLSCNPGWVLDCFVLPPCDFSGAPGRVQRANVRSTHERGHHQLLDWNDNAVVLTHIYYLLMFSSRSPGAVFDCLVLPPRLDNTPCFVSGSDYSSSVLSQARTTAPSSPNQKYQQHRLNGNDTDRWKTWPLHLSLGFDWFLRPEAASWAGHIRGGLYHAIQGIDYRKFRKNPLFGVSQGSRVGRIDRRKGSDR